MRYSKISRYPASAAIIKAKLPPPLIVLTSAPTSTKSFTTSIFPLLTAHIKGVLSEANLNGALLCGANLTKANFTNAKLNRANFTGANLSGANFSGARLWMADFSETDITLAYLKGAKLQGAIMPAGFCDRGIIGLD